MDLGLRREAQTAVFPLSGTAIHAGTTVGWANPETTSILVSRVLLNVTTASSGACTLDVGKGTTATTSNDTFIDGQSVATAGLFDNVADIGSNGKSRQVVPAGYFVTVTEASGSAAGLVGNLYITFMPI